jgi:hypothetical protein
MRGRLLPTALLMTWLYLSISSAAVNRFVDENDVAWSSLGANKSHSMPPGHGNPAANVGTEQNGNAVLLMAKAGAGSETGKSFGAIGPQSWHDLAARLLFLRSSLAV